jgi:hypothetical protein
VFGVEGEQGPEEAQLGELDDSWEIGGKME